MSYKDLKLQLSYKTFGKSNITKSFLIPALKQTKLYSRSVGFFSSGVLDSILDGVLALSRNGGKIRLIASPKLNEEDVSAINLGYEKREAIIEKSFTRDFEESLENINYDRLELLSELIEKNVLDIKIAVSNSLGIYHDKLGILEDFDGNTIVFYGSPNSSLAAYQSNYEKVRVVTSWNGDNLDVIEDEKEEFKSLWEGTNDFVQIYDYQESAKKNILRVVNKKRNFETHKGNSPIELRDYQKEAITAWTNNDYKGFYVMATGTGKTWTAIFSAKELLKDNNVLIVICAPYKHLVKQWSEDVEKAMPDSIVILVSSENPNWEKDLTDAIVRQRIDKTLQIVVISTISSFNLERFQNTILKSKQEKLLIVDEAHRFTNRPDELKNQYKYMLGLSATPFSGKSTKKGKELMDFFGGQVFSLPIEDALKRGYLVGYKYFPIFVNATEEEELEFRNRSAQIASCFSDGKCIDSERFNIYYRARLRIISMAREKIDKIEKILNYIQEKHNFIVYCGDGHLYDDNNDCIRHIEFIKKKLSEKGFKASQFTASENMYDRMKLVETFNDKEIDALAAIRCLDEGINIPSIEGALILSSNDDYREFVQRRGRILRTYKDKQYANIYDVVVLPSTSTPKMAEIEFRRYYEYARLAKNKNDLMKNLSYFLEEYNLSLEDLVISLNDTKEAYFDE